MKNSPPGAVMPRGRPKKQATTHVRLHADLVEMATEVAAHTRVSLVDLLDEILRAPLAARFQAILPAAKAMAKTSPEARERLEEVLAAITAAEEMRRKAAGK